MIVYKIYNARKLIIVRYVPCKYRGLSLLIVPPLSPNSERLPSMATVSSNTVTIVGLKESLVPKQWGETVRIVGMSEYQQVALSLAHAFAADDLALYLLNSEDMANLSQEEKWRLHVDIFQYMVAAHCLNGEVHVIGPDHEGVALW